MRPVRLDIDGFASFREPATVDFNDVDYFALIGPTGAGKSTIVDAITRESKAYAAGLRLGDLVRRFDGVPVSTQNQLLTQVSRLPAGRRVTVSVARPREDGQGFHELDVTFRHTRIRHPQARADGSVPDRDQFQLMVGLGLDL